VCVCEREREREIERKRGRTSNGRFVSTFIYLVVKLPKICFIIQFGRIEIPLNVFECIICRYFQYAHELRY
jgi:hypothetical protein